MCINLIACEQDGMLIGNNFMALNLEGGGHYTCEFKSFYK